MITSKYYVVTDFISGKRVYLYPHASRVVNNSIMRATAKNTRSKKEIRDRNSSMEKKTDRRYRIVDPKEGSRKFRRSSFLPLLLLFLSTDTWEETFEHLRFVHFLRCFISFPPRRVKSFLARSFRGNGKKEKGETREKRRREKERRGREASIEGRI